jgi:hypothetical protein
MIFPVTGFESNGSERYTCLLGIGVVQSGLTCFFTVYRSVCWCVHLQISLWLLWLGFVNAGVAPSGTRVTPRVGALGFNTRRYAHTLWCLCVCVLYLFMYHVLAFGCRLSSWLFYLKLIC